MGGLGGITTVGRGRDLTAADRDEEVLWPEGPGREAGSDLGLAALCLEDERCRAGREKGGQRVGEVASQ